MTPTPPSPKQLAYLRALANRTGQTFAYPATSRDASREIQRLQTVAPSSPVERAIEHHDLTSEQAARERSTLAAIGPDEIDGYLGHASWSQRR